MRIASDYRALGRDALRGRWGSAICAMLLAVLLGGIASATTNGGAYTANGGAQFEWHGEVHHGGFQVNLNQAGVLGILLLLYGLLCLVIGPAVRAGYANYNLRLSRGEAPSADEVLGRMNIVWKALGANLLTGLLVLLGTALFIVPGILLTYRYALVDYVLADHPEMGALDAMAASARLMNGNKLRLFCLQFSFIGWMLLGALTMGIGYLWLAPYMNASIAAFYRDLCGELPVA